MKKALLKFITGMAFCIALPLQAQEGYIDYRTMTGRIDALSRLDPSLCTVQSLSMTEGGKEIRVITIGTGDKDNKPGIAILGGVEGSYLLGREITIGLAEKLLRGHEELLRKVTFYIFPDVSPDASEQFFSPLKYERIVNAHQTDDDRDFRTDEDPYEDLDGNGIITSLRIADQAGRFLPHPDDERIMKEADLSKGESGGYLLFTEGIDNDDDGKFNEDNPGGVNFNRNFTYDYEEFGTNAGLHPVSEPEVKAVADFLYARFNVFAVFAFGPQDNLGQPLKNDKQGPDRRITSIRLADETINKLVSERYHEITGLKGNALPVKTPGNFMEWAYYHYGRYSFSTPGWWFPVEKGKNPETEFMKYAEKNKITDVYIPWKEIVHPGFPGKKAETGGLKPFVLVNPPADSVDMITEKHVKFITEIAALHPDLVFAEIKSGKVENDIYRFECKILNRGVFATMAQVGEMNNWIRVMSLSLEPSKDQEILSGTKVQRIGRLEGGQSAEFSWLIKGKGPVTITAGAVNTGIITTTVDLK